MNSADRKAIETANDHGATGEGARLRKAEARIQALLAHCKALEEGLADALSMIDTNHKRYRPARKIGYGDDELPHYEDGTVFRVPIEVNETERSELRSELKRLRALLKEAGHE